MSKLNYNVYRCLDPIKTQTNTPWYREEDKCPCNPNLSNVTGRGFTPCTFGIEEAPAPANSYKLSSGKSLSSDPLKGALYQDNQVVPPQLQPRQLTRIGQSWRSAN